MPIFDQELIQKVADSLQLPVRLLRRWERRRAISIYPIDGGWRLIMRREPAIEQITKAATDGLRRIRL